MKNLAVMVSHQYFDYPESLYGGMLHFQFDKLKAALWDRNIRLVPFFWQDKTFDFSKIDFVTPLQAWGYPQELKQFKTCLAYIKSRSIKLLNPIWAIEDNFDKSYILRLQDLGAKTVPTIEARMPDRQAISNAFMEFDCDELVIKPRIGAGAWRQARIKKNERFPSWDELPPDEALIQPFMKNIISGELSLLFFNGKFSHALIKTPLAGDYRTQARYGAVEKNITPDPEALEIAQDILKKYDPKFELTYARIDLVKGDKKGWLLMEMELIEPYLYLEHDGNNGKNGANAIAKAIDLAVG